MPVQISSFTATPALNGSDVTLQWSTLSETENFGFYVQIRREGESEFQTIQNSFVAGQGTSVVPHDYVFVDAGPGAGRWWYRLQQVDLNGATHYSNEVSVDVLTSVDRDGPRYSCS